MWVAAILVAAALGATHWLSRSDPDVYRFVLGDLPPTLTTLAVCTLGVASLLFLRRLDWFALGGGSRRGLVFSATTASVLSLPVILVDLFGGFAADINVPPPEALFFYPSIALVAEFAFHVIPLAVLAGGAALTSVGLERARLSAMIAVCTIEPTLQVIWGAGDSPAWANAYVGVHLVVFNLVAVHIFRRYGFLSLYAFRLVYYVWWHGVWGVLRLPILFGGEL